MIVILHGDNEALIHTEFVKYLDQARKDGKDIVRLDAKKVEISNLETAAGTDALFSLGKLVCIDGLFSLPKSKRKDGLIAWIREHDGADITFLLIEKKALTVPQLKSFPDAKATIFKYPAVLFQWLETIGTTSPARSLALFHAVLEREEAEVCFVMLIRQIRTLLAFVADGSYDGAPFLRQKIASQARHFSKDKLLALHGKLIELDEAQKKSRNVLSLSACLDLILVEL